MRQRLMLILYLLCIILPVYGKIMHNGDLAFVCSGSSDFSSAITDATARGDSVSFVHVGIIILGEEGKETVIEASPEHGVRIVAIEEFLEEAPKINGRPGVVIKSLNAAFSADEAIARAISHLGEPYDWWYLPDNGRMYCSELVYESYINEDGKPIFEARPMNFRAPDGSMPRFWTELYDGLGVDVPEGEPGTNPNDMAKDGRLSEVYRYF